jgi:alpha-mannosidase
LGRAAGSDCAHARRDRARRARPPDEGYAGVRGVTGRTAPDAPPLRRHDLPPERPSDPAPRGRHVFEYALRFDGGALSNAALVRAGQDYRTGFLRGDPFEAPLELGGDIVFSCFKGAENRAGLVLRVFNPNDGPEELALSAPARRIRLDESEDADGGLELAPGEIATFLISD